MPFQQHEQTGLVWFTADVLNDVPHGFSTRKGGVSQGIFASLNLGLTRGDDCGKITAAFSPFWAWMRPVRSSVSRPTPPISAPSRRRTPGRVCSVPGTTQMWMLSSPTSPVCP